MKSVLRKNAKNIRKNLDCKNVSNLIIDNILNWNIFQSSKNVLIYHPINNEINLLPLTKLSDKNFYLPKVYLNDIIVTKFDNNTVLEKGAYNILEPCTPIYECKDLPDLPDLIFLPCLMADNYGYRLGYGKGFYDRFLEKISSKTITAIPQYNELICENLPIEKHDKKADFLITTEGIRSTQLLLTEN